MPLTPIEQAWVTKAQQAQNDANNVGFEGVSLRIILYLLREIVELRERVDELES